MNFNKQGKTKFVYKNESGLIERRVYLSAVIFVWRFKGGIEMVSFSVSANSVVTAEVCSSQLLTTVSATNTKVA